MQMFSTIKFFEKEFVAEESKKAYLRACRWLAKNVLSKVEVGETLYNIKKVNGANYPTFKLELYAAIDSSEFDTTFCGRCQEFHKSFFINQNYNCDKCNMKAHVKQIEQKLEIKRSFRLERLNYILNKAEEGE